MELELEAARGGGGGIRVVQLSGEYPLSSLGRGDLPSPADLTVSRRHVSLRFLGGGEESRLAFEVVGKNPVILRSSAGGYNVYRRGEAGELRAGDGLSLSLKVPSFWMVRRRSGGNGEEKEETDVNAEVLDAVARREKRTRERKERERRAVEEEPMVVTEEEEVKMDSGEFDREVEDLEFDLANIDPVKEFGFLSMGHEFDKYPKGRIRPPKEWNWFLEETRRGSDDEEEVGKSKGSRGARKKKKEGEEDWTDESEDEKEHIQSGPSMKRPKRYVTRSKDPKKPRTEDDSMAKGGNNDDTDEEEEEDEEDETLGGFIVNEEDAPVDEPSDDEEEDEFDDEDEDD